VSSETVRSIGVDLAPPFPHREELPAISPVNGRPIGWFPVDSPDRVPERRARLQREAPAWAAVPLAHRRRGLRRLREVLTGRIDELAWSLGREIGRPLVEALGAEILPTIRGLAWLERHSGRALAPERLKPGRVQEWEPYGVIGLLTPWNYPLFLSLPVIAAALVAGNVVLWKPSELAVASSHLIYHLLIEAGLGHAVEMAAGDRAVGAAVIEAGCDKYAVIGSAAMGRELLPRLGRQLKPAVAELSGCDPMLVCADADLEAAASAAVWGRMTGAGQTCMAPKRLFVHASLYTVFLEEVRERLGSLRIGGPTDPRTELGPLRSEELRQSALAAVQDAVRRGAWLVHGGHALPGPGYYLEPALLAGCSDAMRVMREDLLAPVLAVSPVASMDEAVSRANGSPSALTASVWTRDRQRGLALARRLRGGLVSVNDVILPGADPGTPFGGSGDSGYGRTRGAAGLREMVRPRVVDAGPPRWRPRPHLFPYREGTPAVLRAVAALEGASGWRRGRELRELLAAIGGYRRKETEG
jgi:succinate-semialdehyde dehydrogenase / glutarate-semialdehyde dehydrogenase